MYDPLIIDPTMTLGGKQAAFAASSSGMSLKLTHVSFGKGRYDPTGAEVALKTPVGSKITLAGGTRPTQFQIRMLAAWREDLGGETKITEIGYWAGNVLAFIWSDLSGAPAFTKTDGVPAVLFSDIAFDSVPAGSIDLTIDPAESVALAAIAAHEGASNAHPQYVAHALFPDAQADMWMAVTGSANAIVLKTPTDVVTPAYKTGQAFRFKAAYANTGAVTANVNGLGIKAVTKSGGNVLSPGDLRVGAIYDLIYDGTRFQLAGGVGGGQFYTEWPTTATANQTVFNATYTPGSMMVFVGGVKLAQSAFVATNGTTVTLNTGVAAGTSVVVVALSTFAVADTYSKGEYQSFAATQAQAQDRLSTILDRWMSPQRVHEAITSRLQPAPYDLTPGAALVVGSFGMGAKTLAAIGSLNAITAGGIYQWASGATGAPSADNGELIHLPGNTVDVATQILTSHGSNRLWVRRRTGGVWQAPVEMFHSGNVSLFAQSLFDDADPTAARATLGLGTAALANITTSSYETTAGRVMKVGDYGLGSTDLLDNTDDLNTLYRTGFYFAGGANRPLAAGTGFGFLTVVTNAQNNCVQTFVPQSSTSYNKSFQRLALSGVWGEWTEVWTGLNLVKTTSSVDNTPGSILKVGDFGLGATRLSLDFTLVNIDDVTLPNGLYAVGVNTNSGAKPAVYGILEVVGRSNAVGALGRVHQTFYETDVTFAKVWTRVYLSASSSWSTWARQWDETNLVKTVGALDTTPGSMLKVGDFGLGTGLTTLSTSVTDPNTAVVTGFYRMMSPLVNSPDGASQGATLIVNAWNTQTVQQLIIQGTKSWTRQFSTSTWSAWAEGWTSSNLIKTTSALDTTAGAMLKVGDFGLGLAGNSIIIANIDDITTPSGFYRVTLPAGTMPVGAGAYGHLLIERYDASYIKQVYSPNGNAAQLPGSTWVRVYNGAVSAWLPWVRLYDSSQISSYMATLLDDADAAAAQNTLGMPALINRMVTGVLTKDVSGRATVTLTANEASNGVLWFTGALTANISVIVPAGQGGWSVFNRTAGNFTLTVKTATGVGQVVRQGYQSQLMCGGTNIYFSQSGFDDASFAKEIQSTAYNSLRHIQGSYASFWRNDGSNLYLMLTDSGDQYGSYNARRPFRVDLATGKVSLAEGVTMPTLALGTSSTDGATTAFVNAAISGVIDSAPVPLNTLNKLAVALGKDPNFATSMATALGLKAPLASPTFTGDPKAPTVAATDNDTSIATTAFVRTAMASFGLGDLYAADVADANDITLGGLYRVGSAAANIPVATSGTILCLKYNVTGGAQLFNSLSSGSAHRMFWRTQASGTWTAWREAAPTDSPTFTGSPAAPTATGGTNNTQIATTAFVQAALAALVNSSPSTLDTLNELAQALGNDPNFATSMATALGLKAPLASPTFTGDPKAPTAAVGDNDTSIATTAFVKAAMAEFGLGTTATPVAVLATVASTGMYKVTGADADNPVKGSSGMIFNLQDTAGTPKVQLLVSRGVLANTRMFIRSGWDGVFTAWKELAPTDSPTFTGEVQLNSANSLRHVQGSYASFWRNDGSSLYLMLTDSGDQYGTYNARRPFRVDLATGKVSLADGVTMPTMTLGTSTTDGATTAFVTAAVSASENNRVGEVTHFAMATPPPGYLKRNGAAVSRTTYSALFAKIGTLYGAGDGSTTFNLPDSRAVFDRGWDDSRGVDTGRALGSDQESGNLFHTHGAVALTGGAHSHTTTVPRELVSGDVGSNFNAVLGDTAQDGTNVLNSSSHAGHTHAVTVNSSGGGESRPFNTAFLACIKF